MKQQDLFYEGTTKKLYVMDQREQLAMQFLDDLPKNGRKKATVKGKGAINAEISAYFFDYLASYNVPTHFVRTLDKNSLVVKKLDMVPIQMLVWNVATGDLAKRVGFKEGDILETPVLELYLKNKKLKKPFINDYHAYALGLCDRSEMNSIVRIGTKINAVLKSFFARKNLTLVNFNLEFGRSGNQILLGDELSPDIFTIWDVTDAGKFEKNRFSITSDSAKKVYSDLQKRLLK